MNERAKGFVPSLATLANLGSGVLACVFVLEGFPAVAALFILMGTVFDSLDGSIARRLGVESHFGAELDSLADMVSFGIAPAMLVGSLLPGEVPFLLLRWMFVLLYPLCAAWRLARFAVLHPDVSTAQEGFTGLPTTGAGGAAAGAVLFLSASGGADGGLFLLPGLMLLLGFLMVSEFSYAHVGHILEGMPRPLAVIGMVGICLSLLFWERREFVPALVFWSYAFYGPVTALRERLVALRHAHLG